MPSTGLYPEMVLDKGMARSACSDGRKKWKGNSVRGPRVIKPEESPVKLLSADYLVFGCLL